MKDLNVSLTVAEGNTAIILEGKAPDPINPKPLKIEGNIHAPSEFYNKRSKKDLASEVAVSPSESIYPIYGTHVVFDHTNKTIELVINETKPDQINILGMLIENPIFDKLNINNTSSPYESHLQLYQALKFNAHLFTDKSSHGKVLEKLLDFKATVTKTFESKKDTLGNSRNLDETVMDIEALSFQITAPIYNGESAKDIGIAVEVEARNGKPVFYLTSLELAQIKNEAANELFEAEKKHFVNIAIIEK